LEHYSQVITIISMHEKGVLTFQGLEIIFES